MSEVVDWLLLPLINLGEKTIPDNIAWHGRIMVLAWGVAMPIALLLARYYKVTPRQNWPQELDNRFWWDGHRLLNYATVAFSIAAASLVWSTTYYSGAARDFHACLGWSIVFLGILQIIGGQLRGTKGGPTAPRLNADGSVLDLQGDHYDMSSRRRVFERIHKTLGYAALVISITALVLGMWVANAPRWMFLVLATWWLSLILIALKLQRDGRCIDTYQAIWGLDPNLPGARVEPTGWGIRRLPADFQKSQ